MSSNVAKQDLKAFHPKYANKARVLRFCTEGLQDRKIKRLEDLEAVYKFQGKYFYLPNQFWSHKNHQVVLKALQVLKVQGRPVLVLASGKRVDLRMPEFFTGIQKMIKESCIQDQIMILGLIPFEDVLSLIAHSVAVINPSLFEGWSTTVEEAKALGKELILSDIDVHREQSPEKARYFDPHDYLKLAEHLDAAWSSFDREIHMTRTQGMILEQPARRISFAKRFEEIVFEVAQGGTVHRST